MIVALLAVILLAVLFRGVLRTVFAGLALLLVLLMLIVI